MACNGAGMQCESAVGEVAAAATAVPSAAGLTAQTLKGAPRCRKRRAADDDAAGPLSTAFGDCAAARPAAKRAMRSGPSPSTRWGSVPSATTASPVPLFGAPSAQPFNPPPPPQQQQQQQSAFACPTVPPVAPFASVPIPKSGTAVAPPGLEPQPPQDEEVEEIDATPPLPPIWQKDSLNGGGFNSGSSSNGWGGAAAAAGFGSVPGFGACGAGTLVRTAAPPRPTWLQSSSSSGSEEERREWQARALLAALRRAGLLPPDQARQLEASPGAVAAMLRTAGAGEQLRALTATLTPQQQAALWHAWREVSAMAGGAPMLLAAPVPGSKGSGGGFGGVPSCVVSEEAASSSSSSGDHCVGGSGGVTSDGGVTSGGVCGTPLQQQQQQQQQPLGGDEEMAVDPQSAAAAAAAAATAAAPSTPMFGMAPAPAEDAGDEDAMALD